MVQTQSNSINIFIDYKESIKIKRKSIFEDLRFSLSSLEKVRLYSKEIDDILSGIFNKELDIINKDRNIALVALGGYGREELCPHSDIDILILYEKKINKRKIEKLVNKFWDLGLNFGCVVRSLNDSYKILGEEFETDTAYLQSRFIGGNNDLFVKLQNKVIKPYFKRKKNSIFLKIQNVLKERLHGTHSSIFKLEPDMKNDICCLRDCHRFFWAEFLLNKSETFDDLVSFSGYDSDIISKFKTAYELILSIRIELHIYHNRRIDVLEQDVENRISKILLNTGTPGKLLEEFFKTVNIVKKMILILIEKKVSIKGLWLSIKKGLTANYYNKNLFIFDGIIYPSKQLINAKSLSQFEILNIFRFASITQSTLSVDLSNLIIKNIKNISSKEFINSDIDEIFKIILFQGKYIGQNLISMYESEVLSRIIPEFELLNCKVEFDSYHEYTVDQHILLCLATLDDIENNTENELHDIYNKIENKFILRLGVLLHDIGKGIEVDNHSKSGAIIAENICNRLGLNDNEKNTVLFLIYNHLLMSNLSFNREYEEKLIKEFAEKVKNINNLNMLYILTVIDIKNVGSKTWTDWKGIQLKELYNKTHYFLVNNTYIGKKDDYDIKLITPHSYYNEYYPDDIIKHKKWLEKLRHKNEINFYFEDFKNFHQITFIGYDRIHLFSDIVGILTSEGYNILNAKLYLTIDNKVLNFFQLEPDHIRNLTNNEMIINIQKKIDLIIDKKKSADDFINERHKKYPVKHNIRDDVHFAYDSDASIKLDNDSSDNFTIIEIKAKDRFGLLFRISRILNNLKINIVSAKLQMRIDTAFDVFYVTDYLGLKIRDEKKCSQIVETLKDNLKSNDKFFR